MPPVNEFAPVMSQKIPKKINIIIQNKLIKSLNDYSTVRAARTAT